MSYTLIATQNVSASGGAASFSFTSIPQIYTDLVIVMSARTTRTAVDDDTLLIGFNGTTTGVTLRYLEGNGSAPSSGTTPARYTGSIPAGNLTNLFSNTLITIPNYASTTAYKSYIVEAVEEKAATTYPYIDYISGLWSSLSAITQIDLVAGAYNIGQYSTASLYGVNRVPVASAGTTPTVDYLTVAGGGGGFARGNRGGGGGGAGGYLYATNQSVSSGTSLTITVGAGGTGGGTPTNGSNSQFAATTAAVGGGQGGYGNGTVGGSGGGGGGDTATGAAGTSGQGNAGGNGGATNNTLGYIFAGGGGGGAGGAGAAGVGNMTTGAGGNGGIGVLNTITGQSLYYAGGGGGGVGAYSGTDATIAGTGGLGGGGNGSGSLTLATASGQVSTGGGGGGGNGTAGNGGSGVVVLRYPDKYSPPAATTGNPMLTYVNGYRVYTWVGSGSITF